MPTEKITSSAWASVTLADRELWQAQGGRLAVDTVAPTQTDQGIILTDLEVVMFEAGTTVHYRAPHGAVSLTRMVF